MVHREMCSVCLVYTAYTSMCGFSHIRVCTPYALLHLPKYVHLVSCVKAAIRLTMVTWVTFFCTSGTHNVVLIRGIALEYNWHSLG